jgi:hypothetical protein
MKGTCIPKVEPTLVDALSEGEGTRWDLTDADVRPRGIWSSLTEAVP